MRLIALFAAAWMGAANAAVAQNSNTAAAGLLGVWKITRVQHGPAGARADAPGPSQASLYIFTKHHYSRMHVNGDQPRLVPKALEPSAMTAEERIGLFNSLSANTGTYDVVGDTITFKILLAKAPSNPSRPRTDEQLQFSVQSDTLVLTNPQTQVVITLNRLE